MSLREAFDRSFEKQRGRKATDRDFKQGLITSGLVLGLACFGLWKCSTGPETDGETSQRVADAPRGASCGAGGKVTQLDLVAKEGAVLLTAPQRNAPPVTWKATESALPAPVEQSATVRELCRAGDWSEVRVLSSIELYSLRGWVPSSVLRTPRTSSAGRRIYEAADFEWPKDSAPHRRAAVKVMNRIMVQRPDCEALDTQSLVLNGKGSRAVFSIPCFGGGEMQSFDFTVEDASNGRSFLRVKPIGELDAVFMCDQAAKANATHPSTVAVSGRWDFRAGDDGRAQLMTTFTARNAFNLELTFDLACHFTGNLLDDVSVSERSE